MLFWSEPLFPHPTLAFVLPRFSFGWGSAVTFCVYLWLPLQKRCVTVLFLCHVLFDNCIISRMEDASITHFLTPFCYRIFDLPVGQWDRHALLREFLILLADRKVLLNKLATCDPLLNF